MFVREVGGTFEDLKSTESILPLKTLGNPSSAQPCMPPPGNTHSCLNFIWKYLRNYTAKASNNEHRYCPLNWGLGAEPKAQPLGKELEQGGNQVWQNTVTQPYQSLDASQQ